MKNKATKPVILITGGAGFIGSHVTDCLLASGYRVKVLDNLSNGSLKNLSGALDNPNLEFIEGDILNKKTCIEATEGCDYVFHLACLGVRHSIHSPFENHQVNAEGTLNILEAAKKASIKHFFYISTSEIYGRTQIFPIDEDAPTIPLTVYGASKLAGEHYAHAYWECYGLPITVFRIFNNYGPRAHYEGDSGEIIPRSIVKALYGEQPIIFGDGSVTRDFFYVKDTARAMLAFLTLAEDKNQTILNQTYNIGNEVEYSMKYLLEMILEVMGTSDLGIHYMPERPADVPRLWVKAKKFYSLTGFEQAFSFAEGLKETIAYYEELKTRENLIAKIKTINWEK